MRILGLSKRATSLDTERRMPRAVLVETTPSGVDAEVYKLKQNGVTTVGRDACDISFPGDEVMAETARDIDRPRAVEFVYVGKRRRGAWPAGRYRGLVSVDRGGAPLDAREIELTLD